MSQFSKATNEKSTLDTKHNNELTERKAKLTPMEFRVTQERQTERPFSNKYNKHWESGTYHCIVCDTELFRSETKFESSSGWPAFSKVVDAKRVKLTADLSHVGANLLLLVAKPEMARTEVSCAGCNAHLGHLFKDGPKPTGLRYCINSSSLNFVPTGSSSGDNSILTRNDKKDQVDNKVTLTSSAKADSNNRNDYGSAMGESNNRSCCPTNSSTSSSAKICFFQSANPTPSSSINFQPSSNVTNRPHPHMVNSNSSGNLGSRTSKWSNGNGNDTTSLVKRRISLFSSLPVGSTETVSTPPKMIILRETSL